MYAKHKETAYKQSPYYEEPEKKDEDVAPLFNPAY